jgi:hypothetical protein
MNVFGKLAEARAKFKTAKVQKSGENRFQGYKYFELADILNAVTDINREVGLATVETVTADCATLEIVNVDDPADRAAFSVPMAKAELKGCHPVQNLGAAITYVRRYLYQNAYSVAEPDQLDSGKQAMDEAPKNPTQQKGTLASAAEKLAKFRAWVKEQETKVGKDAVSDALALYGFDSLDDVTADKVNSVTHAIMEAGK